MKKVKIGKNYKLVPRKSYVYYDIIQSLQRLVSKPGFLSLCEQWRKRDVRSGGLNLTSRFELEPQKSIPSH